VLGVQPAAAAQQLHNAAAAAAATTACRNKMGADPGFLDSCPWLVQIQGTRCFVQTYNRPGGRFFCKLHGTETGEIPNTQSRSNGISWSLQVCTESRFAPDTFSRASYAAVYPRNSILICRNLSPFYHGNNTHPSIDNSIVS
jgi:hypothetical protein